MKSSDALNLISDLENRFNSSQDRVRAIAATWILAAAAGVGTVLTATESTRWIVPSSVLANLACVLACIGLMSLWILDQVVYQQLLASVFLVGVKHEKDHPEVPPVRSMMLVAARGKGMSGILGFFYLIPMLVFAGTAFLSPWYAAEHMDSKNYFAVWATSVLPIVIVIVAVVVSRFKKPFDQLAASFGDSAFTKIVADGACAEIISKYSCQEASTSSKQPVNRRDRSSGN